MRRKRIMILAAFVLLAGAAAAFVLKRQAESQKVEAEYVLTYGENQAADYPTSRGAYYFADLVKERTGGKVIVQVHPSAELGDEISVVNQLRYGGIDFTRASLSSVADIMPELNVLQLPYLYTSDEHMWRVLDGEIGDAFMDVFQNRDLVPLSWYDAGARSLYMEGEPVQSLEDLKGKKIRVPESSLLADTMRALGAEPVSMAFEKVYSALEKGICNGAENNWPSYQSTRHYEVAKFYTMDGHNRIPELQLISRTTWEKLPEEYRQIIKQCGRESAEYERKLWKEQEQISRDLVCKAGTQVTELSDEELEKFRAAVAPVYEKYAAGQMDVVDAIRALADAPATEDAGAGEEK